MVCLAELLHSSEGSVPWLLVGRGTLLAASTLCPRAVGSEVLLSA